MKYSAFCRGKVPFLASASEPGLMSQTASHVACALQPSHRMHGLACFPDWLVFRVFSDCYLYAVLHLAAEMADVEGVGAAETTEAQQGQPQQQQQQQQQGPPPPQQHCDHHHQQQQQQQQATLDEQLSGRPSDPATTPASLAQHQQEQYSPDWFGGLADMTAPNSTGSMAGIMGLGSTPQQGGLLADPTTHHQQQQQEEEGGMGGVQPKRQRLAGGGADDSPLVFRPTPCKQ